MDKLDELKIQWQQMEVRLNELSEANRRLSEQLSKEKTVSLQTRLADRIYRHAWLGLALPALSPVLYYVLLMPVWVCIIYALYGIVMMVLGLKFAESIRSENLVELPVASAIRRAVHIKLRMERKVIIGCVLVVPILAILAYALPEADREIILTGGFIGLIIGSAFGIHRFVTNHRLARRLIDTVKELPE